MKKLNNKLHWLTMKKFFIFTLAISLALFWACASNVLAETEASFLYRLSNFSGPLPYQWVNLFVDEVRKEIYVVDTKERNVTIFNDSGMEIYSFGDDVNLGNAVDLVVKDDGDILVLRRNSLTFSIVVCNFRGDPISELKLKDFPPDFSGFSPKRLAYRRGLLYLLDSTATRIAVTDGNGIFQEGYNLGSMIGVEPEERDATSIDGFSVDHEGNILFTIPVLFKAYRLSPDGQVKSFGRPGGAPGGFNVVGGIVADDQGYYYVADRLKSAVLVFDDTFTFQLEFGNPGSGPNSLIGPRNLALDGEGRLYVSQLSSRGVSVFKITHKPLKAEPH